LTSTNPAKAFVGYAVAISLDEAEIAKAVEWEQTTRAYLVDLSELIPSEAGMNIAFSAGVSLEEEISRSTNADVRIAVMSYLATFLYTSLTLAVSPLP
jgi:Niemann-Pick C1 protein